MESIALLGNLSDQALLLGLSTTRIAVAFLLLPLFTGDLIPATLRNAIYVAFGILALSLQPSASHAAVMQVNWLLLFAKEAFIGGGLGFLFGSVLWAFEAAGQLIDTKVGATTAQVTDPLSGQQTPLTGAFLGRLANFVFMFSGGLLLLMGLLLDSYGVWPVLSSKPVLVRAGMSIFEAEFGRLMLLSLLIAAPSLVVLFAIDAVLGLVNRFAQQLNVFSLSMSLKTWASTAVLMIMMTSMVEQVILDIQSRPGIVMQLMRNLLGSP
jgi:type III secretion protein T